MPLTEIAIKNLTPREKPYRLADGKGLAMMVHPNGSKYWQLRYRHHGKAKILSLGTYPGTTLKAARAAAEEAKALIATGIDPVQEKRIRKTASLIAADNSFEVIGREWFAKESSSWSSTHTDRTLRALEKDLFPYIGKRAVSEIRPPELLAALRRVEARGAVDLAHRVKRVAAQVFRYAVATGHVDRDPSVDLKGALATAEGKHHAAITEPKELGPLLLAMDSFTGTTTIKAALLLSPLLFVRPGELRQMEWSHVDLDAAEWRFEASKTRQPHIVPLAHQAVEILKGLQPITGRGRYVFPSIRGASRPLSENGVRVALRSLGYTNDQMTPHGFRATARTILDEVLGIRPELIEHQLAHAVRDALGRAYNRTKHLNARKDMMQTWADYLDSLRNQAGISSK